MFTDKTGTLTENDMQFRECSINGLKYVVSEHLFLINQYLVFFEVGMIIIEIIDLRLLAEVSFSSGNVLLSMFYMA